MFIFFTHKLCKILLNLFPLLAALRQRKGAGCRRKKLERGSGLSTQLRVGIFVRFTRPLRGSNFTGIKLAPAPPYGGGCNRNYWQPGANFSILVQKTSKGYKISLAFKVTQKEHSKRILLYLQKYFECGKIHIDNKKENGYKFSVNKLEDILTKIIPHLDKYPLLPSKQLKLFWF